MTTGSKELNLRKIILFLSIIALWGLLTGVAFSLVSNPSLRMAIVALYSFSPLIASLIIDKRIVRDRLKLPKAGQQIEYLFLPTVLFILYVLGVMGATYVFGNLLNIDTIGKLAMVLEDLGSQNNTVLGQFLSLQSVPFVYAVAIIVAIIMGWTVFGFFGLLEEYGWRGFLWDELKQLGMVPANLAIGVIWGLWHMPLVLSIFTYGKVGWLGMIAIIAFTIAMSFVLSAVREKTHSVIPAGALHGMVNGASYSTGLLFVSISMLIGGFGGVVASFVMAALGIGVWIYLEKGTHART